jgi:putative ATP-dependent endonuclease of the OLD family
MHITAINIKNFRLLEDIKLSIEKRTTVIVGRNNSGKTSLTELFRRLLSEKSPCFWLEDFSLSSHEKFWDAYKKIPDEKNENIIRAILPSIEIQLFINYEDNSTSYGALSDFIIDLNPECTHALINIRYGLDSGNLVNLFEDIKLNPDDPIDKQKCSFFKIIKERVPKLYAAKIYAEDPNDSTNQKTLDGSKLHALLKPGFINAQRGLDDISSKGGTDVKRGNILGSILEQLFAAANNSSDPSDQDTITNLEAAIQSIQKGIDDGFNAQLQNLLPAFQTFGYPRLNDPRLLTETTLDVERLLKNHTKVHYAGINGINLPESYNGLGTRNLIYILLQLLEFYKTFTAQESLFGMNLIFIEEPEAHLHPQMQEVFIAKLDEIAAIFSRAFSDRILWPVQFVVTTHSPHMANKAPFEAMRYFLTQPHKEFAHIRTTQVKDLKQGLSNTPKNDRDFLHKYMVLTGCDLLFADKIILIEGATERLMLPEIIKKIDEANISDLKLSSQYISIMEVGGAYAHIFFDLLEFLSLSTLIITDIDTVGDDKKSCEVASGKTTSNSCIKKWFEPNVTSQTLLTKTNEEKIKGHIRLSYQIADEALGACGRSFEDAFILANYSIFGLQSVNATDAYNLASTFKKTDFAIKYGIDEKNWKVPLYISQGLEWLANAENLPILQNDQE